MRGAPALSCDGSQVYVVGRHCLRSRAGSPLRTDGTPGLVAADRLVAGRSPYGSLAVGTDCTIYVAFVGRARPDFRLPGARGRQPRRHAQVALREPHIAEPRIEAVPAVAPDGTVYVVENDGGLVALSSSGVVLWRSRPTDGLRLADTMVGPDGSIYVAGEAFSDRQRGSGLSFRRHGEVATGGSRRGRGTSPGWPSRRTGRSCTGRADDGTIYALDAATGATIWASRVTDDGLSGSPALSGNGILYVQGQAGRSTRSTRSTGPSCGSTSSTRWRTTGGRSPRLWRRTARSTPSPRARHRWTATSRCGSSRSPPLRNPWTCSRSGSRHRRRRDHLVARWHRLRRGLQRDLRRGDAGDVDGIPGSGLRVHGLGRSRAPEPAPASSAWTTIRRWWRASLPPPCPCCRWVTRRSRKEPEPAGGRSSPSRCPRRARRR